MDIFNIEPENNKFQYENNEFLKKKLDYHKQHEYQLIQQNKHIKNSVMVLKMRLSGSIAAKQKFQQENKSNQLKLAEYEANIHQLEQQNIKLKKQNDNLLKKNMEANVKVKYVNSNNFDFFSLCHYQ